MTNNIEYKIGSDLLCTEDGSGKFIVAAQDRPNGHELSIYVVTNKIARVHSDIVKHLKVPGRILGGGEISRDQNWLEIYGHSPEFGGVPADAVEGFIDSAYMSRGYHGSVINTNNVRFDIWRPYGFTEESHKEALRREHAIDCCTKLAKKGELNPSGLILPQDDSDAIIFRR